MWPRLKGTQLDGLQLDSTLLISSRLDAARLTSSQLTTSQLGSLQHQYRYTNVQLGLSLNSCLLYSPAFADKSAACNPRHGS